MKPSRMVIAICIFLVGRTFSDPTPTAISPNAITPYPSPTLPAGCGVTKLGQPGTQNTNGNNDPSILVEGTEFEILYARQLFIKT